MEYQIESNIPIPQKKNPQKGLPKAICELKKVGDSFRMPRSETARQSCYKYANYYKIKVKILTVLEPDVDGVTQTHFLRVWRIA